MCGWATPEAVPSEATFSRAFARFADLALADAVHAQRVREALGEEAVGTITPHSFRHYFVTTILGSTGNLKLAQVLARHTNIAVTQRYSHLSDNELDQEYQQIFD